MSAVAGDVPWRKQVAGLVLAGGLGRRMGGRHKAFVSLKGRPLVEHVTARLRPQVVHLAISANAEAERLRAYAEVVLPDPVSGHAGPLAGVLAGLEWLRTAHPDIPWLLSVPVDTPFLPCDLALRLWQAVKKGEVELAVAASGARMHPVIALWPVHVADALRHALVDVGVRKVGQFVRQFRLACVSFDGTARQDDPFFNVNTMDDLRQARKRLDP